MNERFSYRGDREAYNAAKVKALESLLIEKGIIIGLELDESKEVRVWDSSAQIRWFVLPERPVGTEDMSEAELAALVTPEAMMGVAQVKVSNLDLGSRRSHNHVDDEGAIIAKLRYSDLYFPLKE